MSSGSEGAAAPRHLALTTPFICARAARVCPREPRVYGLSPLGVRPGLALQPPPVLSTSRPGSRRGGISTAADVQSMVRQHCRQTGHLRVESTPDGVTGGHWQTNTEDRAAVQHHSRPSITSPERANSPGGGGWSQLFRPVQRAAPSLSWGWPLCLLRVSRVAPDRLVSPFLCVSLPAYLLTSLCMHAYICGLVVLASFGASAH